MDALPTYALFINGQWQPSQSGTYLPSLNPFTGQPWCHIPRGNAQDVNLAVIAADNAFRGPWQKFTPTQRGALLRQLGDLIAQHADHLAKIEVQDNGKSINEVKAQIQYIPQWFYYFGGLADKIEGAVLPIDTQDMFCFTQYEPLGVVAAIVPWNSPLLITTWKLAPALAAGNTVVLKPSEYTSASAFELGKLIEKAGFPSGVVNIISGLGNEIGDTLVQHPRVAKISFTGGTQTGKHIFAKAADPLKKISLELGGKSPQLVFSDANLEEAAKGIVAGIFAGSGQSCIAGSRLLVHESIHDPLLEKIIQLVKKAKMGNPLLPETQIGPIATYPQFEKILHYFKVAKEENAHCALGGKRASSAECEEGWFIEPTIYTDVHPTHCLAQEEIFGPVLSVMKFKEEEQAITLANQVQYGLAAGIWTQDFRKILTLFKQLQAGTIWVNTYRTLSYLAPFGGYKQSGLGRESGQEAIYEYLQTKSVWLSTSGTVANPFVMRLK